MVKLSKFRDTNLLCKSTYLAVFLQTCRFLALAPCAVYFLSRIVTTLRIFHNKSICKCFRIFRAGVFDCLFSDCASLRCVTTISAITSGAKSFCSKAFAVQFEAARFLAVARTSFWRRFLLAVFFPNRGLDTGMILQQRVTFSNTPMAHAINRLSWNARRVRMICFEWIA